MQPRGEYEPSPKPVRIGYLERFGIPGAVLVSLAMWAAAYALLA